VFQAKIIDIIFATGKGRLRESRGLTLTAELFTRILQCKSVLTPFPSCLF